MKKMIILMIILISGIMATSILGEESISEIQRRNNETEALNQYKKLTENLSKEELNIKKTSSDYYGWAYINDNGNLVVCVTDNYNVASGKIQTYTDNNDIIIQYVDYTYDTLVENYEQIVAKYRELYELFKEDSFEKKDSEQMDIISSICGIYLSETRNKVIVEIDELNNSKIQYFKKYISNDDFIEFDEGEHVTFESADDYNEPCIASETATSVTWGPGYHLNICTTGFPVYFYDGLTKKYGFITAAHAYGVVGNPVWASGWSDVIGECIDTQLGGPSNSLGGSNPYHILQLSKEHFSIACIKRQFQYALKIVVV